MAVNTEYDLGEVARYYHQIVSQSTGFDDAEHVIYFLGHSNAAKATAVAFAAGLTKDERVTPNEGHPFKLSVDVDRHTDPTASIAQVLPIREATESPTRPFVAVPLDGRPEVRLSDTIGVEEMKRPGHEFAAAASGALFHFLRAAKRVSLVYVMSWTRVRSHGAAQSFREALDVIAKVLPSPQDWASLLFVYTDVAADEGVEDLTSLLTKCVADLTSLQAHHHQSSPAPDSELLVLVSKCLRDLLNLVDQDGDHHHDRGFSPIVIRLHALQADSEPLRRVLLAMPTLDPHKVPCKLGPPPVPCEASDELLVALQARIDAFQSQLLDCDWPAVLRSLGDLQTVCTRVWGTPELVSRFEGCITSVCDRVRRLFTITACLLREKEYSGVTPLIASWTAAAAVCESIPSFVEEYRQRESRIFEDINLRFSSSAATIISLLNALLDSEPLTSNFGSVHPIDWRTVADCYKELVTMKEYYLESYMSEGVRGAGREAETAIVQGVDRLLHWVEGLVEAHDYSCRLVRWLEEASEASGYLGVQCRHAKEVWETACRLVSQALARDADIVVDFARAAGKRRQLITPSRTDAALRAFSCLAPVNELRTSYLNLLPHAMEIYDKKRAELKSARDALVPTAFEDTIDELTANHGGTRAHSLMEILSSQVKIDDEALLLSLTAMKDDHDDDHDDAVFSVYVSRLRVTLAEAEEALKSGLEEKVGNLVGLIHNHSFRELAMCWRMEVVEVELAASACGSGKEAAVVAAFDKVREELVVRSSALRAGELSRLLRTSKKQGVDQVVATMAQITAASQVKATEVHEVVDFASLHRDLCKDLQATVNELLGEATAAGLAGSEGRCDVSLLERLDYMASLKVDFLTLDSVALKELAEQARSRDTLRPDPSDPPQACCTAVLSSLQGCPEAQAPVIAQDCGQQERGEACSEVPLLEERATRLPSALASTPTLSDEGNNDGPVRNNSSSNNDSSSSNNSNTGAAAPRSAVHSFITDSIFVLMCVCVWWRRVLWGRVTGPTKEAARHQMRECWSLVRVELCFLCSVCNLVFMLTFAELSALRLRLGVGKSLKSRTYYGCAVVLCCVVVVALLRP